MSDLDRRLVFLVADDSAAVAEVRQRHAERREIWERMWVSS
ncbi:MAG TPA: hypothetical protein VH541_02240 [Gaiellaceae bacterium]